MKIRLLGALVGLLTGFALPIFAQQKETVDPQTIEQLIAFGKKFDETQNNNDAASLAAFFTEDAVLVTNTGPVYGRQAIEKWFTDDFHEWRHSNKLTKGDQNPPRILGTADNIATSGEWSVTIQGKTGDPIQLNGHHLTILTRAGNDWKIRNEGLRIENARNYIALGRELGFGDAEVRKLVLAVDRTQDPLVRLIEEGKIRDVQMLEQGDEKQG